MASMCFAIPKSTIARSAVVAEHQVLRLEIAVQDALLVDVAEGEHQLAKQAQRFSGGNGLPPGAC